MNNTNREAFDKFAIEHGMNVLRVGEAYSDDDTNYAWWVWQKALQQSSEPVAYLKRKKMSEKAIELLPSQAMKNFQREKGWSDWYVIKAKDSCDDWLHDYESIPLFTHPPASVEAIQTITELRAQAKLETKRLDWALQILFSEGSLITGHQDGAPEFENEFAEGTTGRQAIDSVMAKKVDG